MQKIFYILFIFVIFLSGCGTSKQIADADKKFASGEFAEAVNLYKSVYPKISTKNKQLKGSIAFRQGECYRKLNYSLAEQAYNRAVRNNFTDSLVYLRYAQALQKNGKYGEAIKNYKLYLEKFPNVQYVKNQLIFLTKMDSLKSEPASAKIKKNTALNVRRANTFSATILPSNEETVYFTSSRLLLKKGKMKNSTVNALPNHNLFMIKKDQKEKWGKVEALGQDINILNTDVGTANFSFDGKVMFFSAASQDPKVGGSTVIYYTNRAGGEWTEPKKITFFKDSTINVAHPAIGVDGETMYFVSDAPGGSGGLDLWKGKLEGAECKYITNLGSAINTPEDEMFPTVHPDGQLYFSSNGHPGMGGLDIFKATLSKDSIWSVVHTGIPLNSNADDFGISFNGTEKKGFFSSNRTETKGFDSVWDFEIPENEIVVTGKVTDDRFVPIPEAVIRLVSNKGLNVRVTSKKDGTYKIKVDKDMEFVMLGAARGYLNQSKKLNSMGVKGSREFTANFELPAIYRPVQLNNIFFEFAKWNLTPDSESGLASLVSMMKDNPNIAIEISAHTDFYGSAEVNQQLSQRRAEAVVNYLVDAGIAKARLTSVGYGENKPFVVDIQTNKKHPFLELDKSLEESYILKLKPEEQLVANQINRRTEFRVVKVSY